MLKNVKDNVITAIDTLAFDFSREPGKITISCVIHSQQRSAGIKARFINKED